MDKSLAGRNKKSAREFTEEIDRATDAAVDGRVLDTEAADFEATGAGATEAAGLDTRGAAELGARVLKSADFGRDMMPNPGEVEDPTEQIRRMTAEKNGYVQTGLEAGANVVGNESAKEMRERISSDEQNRRIEDGNDLTSEEEWTREKIMQGQEKLTATTVARINKIIKEKSVHPEQLVRERRLGMHAILATWNRKLGERN